MAKSGRSKIKRANRALKREKNSKKELAKLEKMVQQVKEGIAPKPEKVYTVLGAPTTDSSTVQVEEMIVDGEQPTLKAADADEEQEELPMGVGSRTDSGSFPVWMNKRAIKRAKGAEKKKAKQKRKGKRAGSKPWRK
ncbi:protein LLP homolog isoform X2 [Watersipora subatra]